MKKILSSIFYILCSMFVFSTPALAKVMVQEKGEIVIAKGETLDDDLFTVGESITLDGNILGSVFAGSSKYNQTGNIKGDLVLGAGNAMISGTIGGDLYLGAGDVVLSKLIVSGNVVVGSGNVTIDKDSKIGGSLIAGSSNLKNYAPIGRNALIGAATLMLDSKVGKEAKLAGGNINLGPNASIGGDLTYALNEDKGNLTQDHNASVAGTISRYTPPAKASEDMAKARAEMNSFGKVAGHAFMVISFIGSLLAGFLLLKLFPKTSLGIAGQIKHDLLRSLGLGFLFIIFALPVLLVLSLSIIGLPLAGILAFGLLVMIPLAKLSASLALGKFVVTQFDWHKVGIYGIAFIGLLIFYLLRAVPGLGWLVSVLFTWTGLGAIWLYTKSNLKIL